MVAVPLWVGAHCKPPPPPVVCPLPIPPRRGPSSARHLGHIIWGALSRRVLAEVGRGPLSVAHLLPTLRRWPLQGPWLGAPADSWGRQPDWTAPCRVRGSSCTYFISQLPCILSVTRGRLLAAPFHVVDPPRLIGQPGRGRVLEHPRNPLTQHFELHHEQIGTLAALDNP